MQKQRRNKTLGLRLEKEVMVSEALWKSVELIFFRYSWSSSSLFVPLLTSTANPSLCHQSQNPHSCLPLPSVSLSVQLSIQQFVCTSVFHHSISTCIMKTHSFVSLSSDHDGDTRARQRHRDPWLRASETCCQHRFPQSGHRGTANLMNNMGGWEEVTVLSWGVTDKARPPSFKWKFKK